MKFTLLTAFAASASAFAPAKQAASTTALNGYESDFGAMAPVSSPHHHNKYP